MQMAGMNFQTHPGAFSGNMII
ncbi:DUF6783 domain-containing protein [Enterocloster hominis (ex Hitch et al. 2024)]